MGRRRPGQPWTYQVYWRNPKTRNMEAIPGVFVVMTGDMVLRSIYRSTFIEGSPLSEAQFRIDPE